MKVLGNLVAFFFASQVLTRLPPAMMIGAIAFCLVVAFGYLVGAIDEKWVVERLRSLSRVRHPSPTGGPPE